MPIFGDIWYDFFDIWSTVLFLFIFWYNPNSDADYKISAICNEI